MPIATRLYATLGGSAPANHLPLPDAHLKDNLEDGVYGEAEEVAVPEREEGELASDMLARSQQHAVPAANADVLASLPLGASLRQEVHVQGQPWTFETGKLARLASGSCMVQCGSTTVLAAATSQPPPWSRRDVLSLQLEVDYREKLYAVGRIPGTYNKREGTPKDHEVLAGRRIGRALRPLFPRGFAQDAALFASVLSADGAADPCVMAVGAASAALLLSDMPWAGPVAAARVALTREGQLVSGPSVAQQEAAALDILVAATAEGRVTMLEAGGEEVPEAQFVQALRTAVAAAQQLAQPQLLLAQQSGRTTVPMRLAGADSAAAPRVAELATPLVDAILRDTGLSKNARAAALQEAKEAVLAQLRAAGAFRTEFARLPGSGCVSPADVDHAFSAALGGAMRRMALQDGLRVDGRGPVDLRSVHCEVDSIPVVHGSALFTRGETQSLCTATVGRRGEQQRMESLLGGEGAKRLFVNYSFPPFAVGETSLGGMRREVGHSDLAERALLPVLPNESDFPFSLRLNADTLASSGSSSMAAVCGGSLALLDAGVPLKGMVAGVSVGLFTEASWGGEAQELGAMPVARVSGVVPPSPLGRYELLLDQLGMEDQLGDMDLKVAGTRRGITACQLDVKLQGGVPLALLEHALALAARGRAQLLRAMEAALPAERPAHAPAFGVVQVPPTMLGRVIGTGGANLRELEEERDARVDVADDGTIRIFAASGEGFRAAHDRILELAGENIKEGQVYRATVARLMDYGALLEVHPGGMRSLLHISELAPHRVRSVGEELAVGQEVEVMCLGRDARGQLKLSRKAVLKRDAVSAAAAASVAQGGAIDPDSPDK